jgi:hypothetical protein
MIGSMKTASSIGVCHAAILFCLLALPVGGAGQASSLPTSVAKVCSIQFDRDTKRPARVEDSALQRLKEAAQKLRGNPGVKLVLVGIADPVKDHEADENGHMRETEDPTGLDVRWEDLAAYRSLNTKWYLTRWFGIKAVRILPTTDESIQGQEVTFYFVPADADFNHNYLGTTKTNERPCTVKPCYSPDEESLKAQPRSRIPETAGISAGRRAF